MSPRMNSKTKVESKKKKTGGVRWREVETVRGRVWGKLKRSDKQ